MNDTLVVFIRSIVAFFSLLIFTRFLGKQQVSHLTFFDYILGITIGSIAATLTTDLTSRAWPHWVGLFSWTSFVFILQWVTVKSHKLSKYIDGEPAIVIMNGQIMEGTMKKLRYRAADLTDQLRDKGIFDMNEVAFAILETNGKLSVLKKSPYQPVTPKDLNLPPKSKGVDVELIYDGRVLKSNLKQVNKNMEWLENQIRLYGFTSSKDVFLATYQKNGSFYIDGYRDHLSQATDVSDYNDLE